MIESSIVFTSGNQMDKNPLFTNFRLTNVGYAKLIDIDQTVKKGIDSYDTFLIFYIFSGKMFVNHNNKKTVVEEGSIYILSPDDRYEYSFNRNDVNEHYYYYVTGSETRKIFSDLKIPISTPIKIGIQTDTDSNYKILYNNFKINNFTYNIINTSIVFDLLVKASISYNNLEFEDTTNIAPALKDMENNYAQNRTIDDYAKLCNLSKFYFIKEFKKQTGSTPQQYLIKRKINIAKMLLETTKMTITQIAYSIGYNNPLYFSNVFKSETNLSPKQYRNYHLNKFN